MTTLALLSLLAAAPEPLDVVFQRVDPSVVTVRVGTKSVSETDTSTVVAVTVGFALTPDRSSQQTLLLGGNLVWLATLCGLFIGDLFRPSWAT